MERLSVLRGSALAAVLALLAIMPRGIFAQQQANLTGDYSGMLGSLRVKLHIRVDAQGAFSCTLDHQSQGVLVPCSSVKFDGKALSFEAPFVNGSWKGTAAGDGRSLSGIWI